MCRDTASTSEPNSGVVLTLRTVLTWPFKTHGCCLAKAILPIYMHQFEFRRQIVDVYLRRYAFSKRVFPLRSQHIAGFDRKAPSGVRQDGRGHFITSESTQ